jgi:PadR family transcriptional regulator PadR
LSLPFDRVQGTLDMLILKTLVAGPQHGWAISQTIRERSGEAFQINQGALYPALHRLEDRGWVKAEWGTTENNRKARFYTLTRAGRAQLTEETNSWLEYIRAVNLVMRLST